MSGRKYNHEQVLQLWASGLTAAAISEQMGMPHSTTSQVIVLRARKKGDPRAVLRAGLPKLDNLYQAASQRGISKRALVEKLLLVIARNPDLIEIILDEAEAA